MNRELIKDFIFKKGKFIMLGTAAGVLALFAVAQFFLPRKYTAQSTFCVNITNSFASTNTELIRSEEFAASYVSYLQHEYVIREISAELSRLNKKYSPEQLKRMMKVEFADSSRQMVRVSVTADDSDDAYTIAELIPRVAERCVYNICGFGSVTIVYPPQYSETPSSPVLPFWMFLGGICGFFLTALFLFLYKLYARYFSGPEEIVKTYQIPMLGSVPLYEEKKASGKTKKQNRGTP